ncbi:DUF4912 domain-containing protein [Neobacillus jeddahensis]|uniref:DUF4912 domain-containing protein n=1 Tax=Neobacillus jeddahensis TaxID=1461580 RepID=UPI00058EA38A|nr:DUF4912 domain-containing protein [Neobacillus jeddahensis]
MIDEIIKLRGDGLSFRKIALVLNTSVGKVQYRWNKWLEQTEEQFIDSREGRAATNSNSSENNPVLDALPLNGELKAKLVTPRKMILFWDVSVIPQKIIELFYGRPFKELVTIVRLYDVTGILFNGVNAHHFNEITVPYNNGHWFIKGLEKHHSYIAELGIYLSDSEFFPIYRSNCVQTSGLELLLESVYQQDVVQIQRYEEEAPKWVEHVSTYSYYLKSDNLEEKNEQKPFRTS